MNPRITAKERGLLKGAVRRVFSRSDLRRKVLDSSVVTGHTDPARPRVKKWSRCSACKAFTASYQIEVDHLEPIVPIDRTLEDMTWDEVINRVWCPELGLQALCGLCHDSKTKVENALRRGRKKRK